MADPRVRKLSFTGSTEVGRQLLRQGADTVLSCSMELGGNAPFIVFEDADLDAAIEGAMIAKMRNGGEACTAANRFYVHERVYDAFVREDGLDHHHVLTTVYPDCFAHEIGGSQDAAVFTADEHRRRSLEHRRYRPDWLCLRPRRDEAAAFGRADGVIVLGDHVDVRALEIVGADRHVQPGLPVPAAFLRDEQAGKLHARLPVELHRQRDQRFRRRARGCIRENRRHDQRKNP